MQDLQDLCGALRDRLTDDQRKQAGFVGIIPRPFEAAAYVEVGDDSWHRVHWTNEPPPGAAQAIGAFMTLAESNMPPEAATAIKKGFQRGDLGLIILAPWREPTITLLKVPPGRTLSESLKDATVVSKVVMMDRVQCN